MCQPPRFYESNWVGGCNHAWLSQVRLRMTSATLCAMACCTWRTPWTARGSRTTSYSGSPSYITRRRPVSAMTKMMTMMPPKQIASCSHPATAWKRRCGAWQHRYIPSNSIEIQVGAIDMHRNVHIRLLTTARKLNSVQYNFIHSRDRRCLQSLTIIWKHR